MSSPDAATTDQTLKRSILAYHRPRGLLAIASAVCFGIFWWVGGAMSIPDALYLDPSLATQASPVVNFLIIGLTLIACTVVGTLIAGTVRADAGFFAACAGMMALAIRFGPAGQVYREADSRAVYLWLAAETLLFFSLVAAAWWVQVLLHRRRLSVVDQVRDGMEAPVFPLGAKVLASGTHVAATCLLLLLLLRSDVKAQALASIVMASLVGSLVAHSLFATTPSVWMWAATAVTGLLGFFMGFGTPGAWEIGHPVIALARATPLDYAAAGPVGALIGYWMSRKWHAGRQYDAIARQTVIVAPSHAPRG